MKRKHARTLELLFKRPVSGSVKFQDVLALLEALGATVEYNREGSRIGVLLFDETRVLHKPHPAPVMDKGAVAAVRDWLADHGVTPS